MIYKCVNCGGNVVFDPQSGHMKCLSCGGSDCEQSIPSETPMICPSCGSQITYRNEYGSAGKCPACGTFLIRDDFVVYPYGPDMILPFKLSKHLAEEKDTMWRINRNDMWQNHHYEKCVDAFSSYMKDTSMPSAPWYIIDAKSKKWPELQVLETLTQGIDIAFHNRDMAVPLLQNVFPLEKMPLLSEIPLDKELADEEYQEELKQLQTRLGELHNRLYRKKVPVIIAYEGWDAAGKGGNIKRITGALDPRGYEVHPIASPEPHEKARHYLWRFWTRLPKTGHIAIFDRTWYGRVMVERLEGFCSENDWKRAYNEINEFEKELCDWGAVIIKFWVQIDKVTQLRRFTDRQNTPEKQWKITDEDWRNREKWDQYEIAVNEMIARTSTTYAPWHILESVDKKYARIKSLKIVVEELEKVLDTH